MKLRPYRPQHLQAFTPRADFAADFEKAGRTLWHGRVWTVVEGERERIVGVTGLSKLAPGQYAGWALMADLRPREWLAAARLARRVLPWARALLEKGPADIYAIPADTDAARRLLAFIGFRPSVDAAGPWKFIEPEVG